MHLSVYEQSEIFYYAFILGIGLGLYYDFYRFLRYVGFCSKSAVIVQDIIFMSTSAVLCFLFAELTVNGHFRVFTMLAHLLGGFAYRYSVGMLSGKIFKVVSSLLNFIKTIAEKAFNKTFGFINHLFGVI